MGTLQTEVIEAGAKRDWRGRRILPAERIEALVSEFHASGVTQAVSVWREVLKYSTLAGWVHARRAARIPPSQ